MRCVHEMRACANYCAAGACAEALAAVCAACTPRLRADFVAVWLSLVTAAPVLRPAHADACAVLLSALLNAETEGEAGTEGKTAPVAAGACLGLLRHLARRQGGMSAAGRACVVHCAQHAAWTDADKEECMRLVETEDECVRTTIQIALFGT